MAETNTDIRTKVHLQAAVDGGINFEDLRKAFENACDHLEAADEKIEQLEKRLRPTEFFNTELLSLEQVMPLACRTEANVVIDTVFAEIAKFKAKIEQAAALEEIHTDQIESMAIRIEQQRAENKRLEEALLIYGVHLDDCPCYIPPGKWNANDHRTKTLDELDIKEKNGHYLTTVKCTCGFEQALKDKGDSQNGN